MNVDSQREELLGSHILSLETDIEIVLQVGMPNTRQKARKEFDDFPSKEKS